jgi:rhamnosyltransferase
MDDTILLIAASVVILTKDAGTAFRQTLEALHQQKTDWPYELIAVDSGSADGTLDLLSEFSVRVHSIDPSSFNFGRTRDLGFSLAQGSYIVTLSQDVVPADSDWLAEMCKPFDDPGVAAVMGVSKAPEKEAVFFWERMGLFYFSGETTRWVEKYGCGLSFVSCAVRRTFWEEHRISATPFGEDKRFQISIADAGKQILVARRAVALHGHDYDLRSLVTRLVGEGVGWRHAGEIYTLRDCLRDVITHRWMLRLSVKEFIKGNIRSLGEFLFPILRPACLYIGNRRPPIRDKDQ